jgi:hypothetical protein
MLPPPPGAPLAGGSASELGLETCANVFGQEGLLAEKPNNDFLAVLSRLNENREQTDLATIILNLLLMRCRCYSLFQAAS